MKGYKGFNKGLVCRGKQYAENTIFEEAKAVICHSGMHFCENPLDVLDYYPLLDDNAEPNEFAEVEALAAVDTDDKKKYTTTKLRIGAKLTFAGLVKASVDFMLTTCKKANKKDSAQMASSGDYAQMASSGYYAKMASSGCSAKMASSGDYAQMASSGDYAKMASSGKNSVVAAIGYNNIAKAAKGSWITLAEWERNDEGKWIPALVKTRKVDGKHIKADTWYKLKNGKFEVCENGG